MLVFDLSDRFGRLRLTGSTRLDFVQRMSTGDMRGLQAGEGRTTVFTTPIGRMVDYTLVLAEPDSLLLVCGGGNQERLARWLRKYILFNDDVQVSDESSALPMLGIFGPEADAWAETVQPGASSWPLYTHRAGLVKAQPLQGAGYYWIGRNAPIAQAPSPLSEYEALRIAAGYPAYPGEINEDYIPLEAGLLDAVSFTKGCYIGQEIIARMESRGQLAKKLARLQLTSNGEASAQPGDRLLADSAEVGVITSVSPAGDAALGYVRSAHAQPGARLRIAGRMAQGIIL
ncbi:MAG: CAF17-like 4Fe-4S cluster assembly/insertion protein YgfZ [Anaerolineae bacterium]